MDVPNPNVNSEGGEPTGGSSFQDVAARSADDVWAVGGGRVIEHWDGKRWSVVPTPEVNLGTFVTVSADAADDVWAAGSGADPGIGPVIEHWDGQPPDREFGRPRRGHASSH
jgi:hypothetical protein